MIIEVMRYRKTRNWQVRCNGQLLAVTVYKKGALAVRDKINDLLKKEASPC
jgi:hypothetical protein